MKKISGLANRDPQDPRVQKTRAALLGAFNRLFLEQGYDSVTPANIAAAAGVGRSSFYEHFDGKPSLLRQSVTAVLQPLAEAASGRPVPRLSGMLAHVWDNRRFARHLLEGPPRKIIQNHLSDLIEEILRRDGVTKSASPSLIALSIAAAQLALLEGWMSGRHACSIESFEKMIIASSAAGRTLLQQSSS